MRISRSRCVDGKEIRITYFGPLYGLMTVPYFILSAIAFYASAAFTKLRAPFLPKALARMSPASFFAIYALLIAGNWAIAFGAGRLHPPYLVAVWLFLSYDIQILSMQRIIPRNEQLASRVRLVADCHPLSASITIVALLITLQYLPVLLTVFTDSTHGWAFWCGILYVYYSPLVGPIEFTEHVASHAARGRLFVTTLSIWALPISVIDVARRYLLYTAIGYSPDYYLLTHAYHHHREANAPTDWQSTLRYPRDSVIGIAHYAFFTTLSNGILPFATLLYFLQRREWKLLRRTVGVLGYQVFYYAVLFWLMGPWVFVVLGARWLKMGMGYVAFSFPWHGLHSNEHDQEALSATHDPSHLVHHEYPGLHLLDIASAQAKLDKIRSREAFGLTRMFTLPGPMEEVGMGLSMFAAFLRRDRTLLSKLLMSAEAARTYRFPELGSPETPCASLEDELIPEDEFDRRLAAVAEARFRVSRADAWLSFKLGGAFLYLQRLMSS